MIEDTNKTPLLRVEHLSIHYTTNTFSSFHRSVKHAVSDISFDIFPGECFAILGESGCGKSSIIDAILGFVHPFQGTIYYNNTELTGLSRHQFQNIRHEIQPVFQNFNQALNPRMRAKDILTEVIKSKEPEAMDRVLNSVGLNQDILESFPHQLSGGQKQRLVLARALCVEPKLLLLDEPASSLDLSVAIQIIELLKTLRKTMGISFLLVSHNIAYVRLLADRIAIMRDDRFLEIGTLSEIIRNSQHPYTRTLIKQTVNS